MKQFTFFLLTVILSVAAYAQTPESADRAPDIMPPSMLKSTTALWDIQLSVNATTAAAGDVGMAGIALFNDTIWVSRWGSDTIYKFSKTGTKLEEFVIAGLTGVRSITTDGTYLFMGCNSLTIYRVDPTTKTLAPPHITSASVNTSRYLTYDQTLNAGAGGFWTGNFNTDIEAINMSGTVLVNIPAATHTLSGMYGVAVDNLSVGGPYLWVFAQMGTSTMQINALQLPAGTPTAIIHDAFPDISVTHSLTSSLAGGAFFTNQLVPGQNSLLCLAQGTPSNVFFAYHIDMTSTNVQSVQSENDFNIFQTNDLINITFAKNTQNDGLIHLYDVSGRILITEKIAAHSSAHAMNINTLPSGLYVMSYVSNEERFVKKVVIK